MGEMVLVKVNLTWRETGMFFSLCFFGGIENTSQNKRKKPVFLTVRTRHQRSMEQSEQKTGNLRGQNVKNTPQLLGFIIFLITSEINNKVSLSDKKGVWGLFFGEGVFDGISILTLQA